MESRGSPRSVHSASFLRCLVQRYGDEDHHHVDVGSTIGNIRLRKRGNSVQGRRHGGSYREPGSVGGATDFDLQRFGEAMVGHVLARSDLTRKMGGEGREALVSPGRISTVVAEAPS
jgi:hypothetical protein